MNITPMNAVSSANQICLKDEMVVLGLFSVISGLTRRFWFQFWFKTYPLPILV
jgi:hypothetical protein